MLAFEVNLSLLLFKVAMESLPTSNSLFEKNAVMRGLLLVIIAKETSAFNVFLFLVRNPVML
uniref:Uncharacterized protein n=1 Tax=Arcella intermedia TaxID=1963864 RepID=A0A6B2LX48_9EUKA